MDKCDKSNPGKVTASFTPGPDRPERQKTQRGLLESWATIDTPGGSIPDTRMRKKNPTGTSMERTTPNTGLESNSATGCSEVQTNAPKAGGQTSRKTGAQADKPGKLGKRLPLWTTTAAHSLRAVHCHRISSAHSLSIVGWRVGVFFEVKPVMLYASDVYGAQTKVTTTPLPRRIAVNLLLTAELVKSDLHNG
ncbi:unnamed protein product [Pleuronectes platessa]|uniref:Uncharacterized protein n=1 Tax=Pleuronectes platessa TaxID=8262 RepID=A0A9N7UAU0_PLEPL|nr:unnamed protein product [Pleuronectes platessa]